MAKGLGARWDPQQRSWYVPHGVDIEPFKAWWPAELKAQGADALAKVVSSGASTPRRPTATPASSGKGGFITGPAEMAPDLSDKLPWEN